MVLVVLAGCADPSVPEAQPAPEVTGFGERGTFDQLPRYPRSDPAGEAFEQGDVITQSYFVKGASPHEVATWYAGNLAGWETREAPSPFGDAAYRAVFARQSQQLTVSAGPAPAAMSESVSTQYSLNLTK